MSEQQTTSFDYAADLEALAHEAANPDGPTLKRGEVAALALLGAGEIRRLREAAETARHHIDVAMGDTDPQDDDDHLLLACQALSEALANG